jgi:Protein O-mannosyl-transferase TMEM260-like
MTLHSPKDQCSKKELATPIGGFILFFILSIVLSPTGAFQWGDGLELVACSQNLGIAHPSGYPLFTILAKIFLTLGAAFEPYTAVLFMCRLAILGSLVGIFFILKRLLTPSSNYLKETLLTLLFGVSFLCQSAFHVVEIYALNLFFLTWIVYFAGFSGKSEKETVIRLLVACVIQGLAASHHLTSLCTLPLIILAYFQLIRKSPKFWWTALLGIVAMTVIPVLLYASLMWRAPITGNEYGIFWGGAQSLPELLDHIRGGEYRQFQFLMMAPGHSFTLESWGQFYIHRQGLLINSLGALFFGDGPTSKFSGLFFIIVFIYGIYGYIKDRKELLLPIGVLIALLLQLAFIFTYNIPDIEDYFLAIQFFAYLIVAKAMIELLNLFLLSMNFPLEKQIKSTRAILIALVLFAALANFAGLPYWKKGIAENWQNRILKNLPKGASLITQGDADIYTIWYTQMAQGDRMDLAAYGGNFVRFPWFRYSLPQNDPRREAVGFLPEPPTSLNRYITNIHQLAIAPMLAHGPVYTTIFNPQELQALSQWYEPVFVAELLTQTEYVTLRDHGEVNIAPPVLYQLRSKAKKD